MDQNQVPRLVMTRCQPRVRVKMRVALLLPMTLRVATHTATGVTTTRFRAYIGRMPYWPRGVQSQPVTRTEYERC